MMTACLLTLALLAQDKQESPKVEAVFVLDTTGSMGGLIDGAKKKIWSIVNEIASGKPTPVVKVGFVIYRDKGDQYVTKTYDLTEDLDKAFADLKTFAAGGGGDGPEHVTKGLSEAVDSIHWSNDKVTYKVIFLVGDAPAHTDYQDGDYKPICQAALRKDILINTVRCGGSPECEQQWQEIARLAEGKYISIAQNGGMAVRSTPFDKDIADLGGKIDGTRVAHSGREKDLEKKCEPPPGAAAPATAERVMFSGKSGQMYRNIDLITDIMDGRVKLEDLKDEQLPEEMRKMSKDERQAHVESKIKERQELTKKLRDLEEKRSEYLKADAKKDASKGDSFDGAVLKTIEEQAKKKGIEYTK